MCTEHSAALDYHTPKQMYALSSAVSLFAAYSFESFEMTVQVYTMP